VGGGGCNGGFCWEEQWAATVHLKKVRKKRANARGEGWSCFRGAVKKTPIVGKNGRGKTSLRGNYVAPKGHKVVEPVGRNELWLIVFHGGRSIAERRKNFILEKDSRSSYGSLYR